MSFTISDLVVKTLEKAGVRRVYGLPGDSLNGLTDALRRNGNLAWEHVRHEEAAAFAAAGMPPSPASWPSAPQAAVRGIFT
jgi:pyruvate dehydrogenase (quinone)